MRRRILILTLLALAAGPAVVSADDGDPRFHRTTPRAALDDQRGALVIGIPAGRAWGIESELRPLPPEGTTIVVRLGVADDLVREAFVRIAYYASLAGRTRQLATADSDAVGPGRRGLIVLVPDRPPGAVAYRIRVLARLAAPGGRSSDDAITAVLRIAPPGVRPLGPALSRLLP